MLILTDHDDYAARLFPDAGCAQRCDLHGLDPTVRELLIELSPDAGWTARELDIGGFDLAILVKRSPRSQFDVLRDRASADRLPTGNILCLAESGNDFHGHKGRHWTAMPGNLHLSAALAPRRELRHFGAIFMALPAVAAASAIETVVPHTRPVGIKWVNDVIVDGAKIAGVIAHTRSSGSRVDQAVLGIGLNVEAVPEIVRSPYVPRAGALRQSDPKVTQHQVLKALLHEMETRYAASLVVGAEPLLTAYRERSLVLGRHVEIHPDATGEGETVAGRVKHVGNDLELVLDGRSAPVTRGRLLVTPEEEFTHIGRNP